MGSMIPKEIEYNLHRDDVLGCLGRKTSTQNKHKQKQMIGNDMIRQHSARENITLK